MEKEPEFINQNDMEYQAGSTLLDEGISFDVPIIGKKKIRLYVKPLRAGTIVKISQQVTRFQKINESDEMIAEMLAKGENLVPVSKIVAYGVLNSRIKIKLFGRILSNFLLWKVESLEYLFAYVSLVYRQMGAQHFFFIMALTKGMNFLERTKTTENIAAEKPSGEPLQ
jgi:hypothetical protein